MTAKRIPEISVLVEDNQIWKADNFEAKIIHIPGHTTGHISFYFFNEKANILLVTHYFHLVVEKFLKVHIKKCLNLY